MTPAIEAMLSEEDREFLTRYGFEVPGGVFRCCLTEPSMARLLDAAREETRRPLVEALGSIAQSPFCGFVIRNETSAELIEVIATFWREVERCQLLARAALSKAKGGGEVEQGSSRDHAPSGGSALEGGDG